MKAKDHELVVFIDQPHGVAISLFAAIGDITRFQDGDHAPNYPRLTPCLLQSPTKRYLGRTSRCGSSQKRAILVQVVQASPNYPGLVGELFRLLLKRNKYNIAVTATARKMVTIAYLILKHSEPYRYEMCNVIKKMLIACRRQANSRVRKTRVRVVQLNALYREPGTPASQSLSELSAKERRALKMAEVTGFAKATHRKSEPKKTLCRTATKTADPN